MSDWFLSHAGKKSGPMRAKQIARLIAGGAFRANEAKVWKEGMVHWETIADSGLLTEASLEPEIAAEPEAEEQNPQSPYKAPESPLTSAKEQLGEFSYGGIGRLAYFFGPLGIAILFYVIVFLVLGVTISLDAGETTLTGMVVVAYLGVLGVIIWMHVARIRNLGMSAWWFFGLLVPILNVWLQWRLTVCPEGYANHRQLDTAGKVLTFFFVVLPLALIVIGLIFSIGTGLAE